jgi:putative transposase
VLLRLAYLTVANTFAVLRLLPMSDWDKASEILALRHQIVVLERQLGKEKVRFAPSDRAFLAALLQGLPPQVLRRLRLLVRPDTILRWHREPTNIDQLKVRRRDRLGGVIHEYSQVA